MIMIWHKRKNTPTQAQLLKSWHSCIPRRSTKTATLIAQLTTNTKCLLQNIYKH